MIGIGKGGLKGAVRGAWCFLFPGTGSMDSAGNIFIADKGNHRIRVVNHSDLTVTTVAGSGVQDNLPVPFPEMTGWQIL